MNGTICLLLLSWLPARSQKLGRIKQVGILATSSVHGQPLWTLSSCVSSLLPTMTASSFLIPQISHLHSLLSFIWWSCLIFYQENRSCQKRAFSFFHDRFYTPSMSVNLSAVVSKDEIPTSQRPIPNMCLIPSFFSFTSLVNFFPLCFYFHYFPFLQSHSSISIVKTRQNQTSPLLPQFPSAIAVFIFSLPIHYSTHLSQLPTPSHLVTLIKYH